MLKDPFDDDLFASKVSVGRGQTFPSFTAETKDLQAEVCRTYSLWILICMLVNVH